MKEVITSTQRIGDIVTRFPGAMDVFKANHIDFCCGGDRPLKEAIHEQELNEEVLIDTLNKTYWEAKETNQEDKDWRKESLTDLINHIVNTHHAYLQTELPRLSELTTKILRAHGARHGEVLSKVHRLFNELKMELEQHLIKEEETLFPLIKEYENTHSSELKDRIIQVMKETEDEHENAGDLLKELRRLTEDYAVPSDGCSTFKGTYQRLQDLESDLFQHIHLENNILFPRVK